MALSVSGSDQSIDVIERIATVGKSIHIPTTILSLCTNMISTWYISVKHTREAGMTRQFVMRRSIRFLDTQPSRKIVGFKGLNLIIPLPTSQKRNRNMAISRSVKNSSIAAYQAQESLLSMPFLE